MAGFFNIISLGKLGGEKSSDQPGAAFRPSFLKGRGASVGDSKNSKTSDGKSLEGQAENVSGGKEVKGNFIKQGLNDLDGIEDRVGADSIQLWESFRTQSLLWRAIAILQFPALLFSFILMLFTFFYSDRVVEAPSRPRPMVFEISDISDADLRKFAIQFVSLIGSYQPATVEKQFKLARTMLWEPALSGYSKEFIGKQLERIKNNRRSQLFYISDQQVKVLREPDWAEVRVPGKRQKLIGTTPRPTDEVAWFIKIATVPATELNPFGLVIIDLKPVNVSLSEIAKGDREQLREEKRKNRGQRRR